MTTRLHCRECGWHSSCQWEWTALRAAAKHHCSADPRTATSWWWLAHLWARVRGLDPPEFGSIELTSDTSTDLVARRDTIRWVALAAHHAETTRRSRLAMAELVRAGYQIGPPPYGYRALRVRVTAPDGHSKLRVVLVPEWRTAAVVAEIFQWRAESGVGYTAIARRLNSQSQRYPTPVPSGRWTADAVRRIITNPKYTGRQVWARTVRGRPVPVEQWITSAPMVHEPLVDERTYRRAQRCHAVAGRQS
jgi:hypothetical protein